MLSREEIVELCCQLRGEKLLIDQERTVLRQLNEQVIAQRSQLQCKQWVCQQQRLALNGLIYSEATATPATACRRADRLENHACFIEGYKRLGSLHENALSDLLQMLVNSPSLVAEILHYGENFEGSTLKDLVEIIFNSIVSACLLPHEERQCLMMLDRLISLQLTPASNPRKLLRKGSCAFSRLYKLFSDNLYAARLFLTAALHDSIMHVLSQDEFFLDIDPSKAVVRFPAQERIRRFGDESSQEYRDNLAKYRKIIVNKLTIVTMRFIDGIRQNLHIFPASIIWLVRRLYDQLVSSDQISKEEATMICTDLVFTLFICPAITNPEPMGIIADVPISYIARFNLMQIGQIFQVLAVCRSETIDQKQMDLYSQFDQSCMSNVMQYILGNDQVAIENLYSSSSLGGLLSRTSVLIRRSDLNKLLAFLKSVQNHKFGDNERLVDDLRQILNRLPEQFIPISDDQQRYRSAGGSKNTSASAGVLSKQKSNAVASNTGVTISNMMSPAANAMKQARNFLSPVTPSVIFSTSGNDESSLIFSKHNGLHGSSDDLDSVNELDVYIIPIAVADEPVGLMSEDGFSQILRKKTSEDNQVKKTRFSLTHDLESVAASDHTEGVESCSNQSVCSSVDMETNPEMASILADNLSDMLPVSANVSGRGTPSMSGRDTPLSLQQEPLGVEQSEGDAEGDIQSSPSGIPVEQRPLPDLPVTAKKENRQDIEEKFGKFEIPPPQRHRDDAHSLVSDSWSTDVLASESEFGGAYGGHDHGQLPDVIPGQLPDIPRLDLIAEEGVNIVSGGGGLDVFEERSETWSVDVMASDSEADPSAACRNEDQDLGDLDDAASTGTYDHQIIGNLNGNVNLDSAAVLNANNRDISLSDNPADSDKLRRQSSCSSFYSRSDVDSEVSGPVKNDIAVDESAFTDVSSVSMIVNVSSSVLSDKTPSSSTGFQYSCSHNPELTNHHLSKDHIKFSGKGNVTGRRRPLLTTPPEKTALSPSMISADMQQPHQLETDVVFNNDDHSEDDADHPLARQSLGRLSFILGSVDSSTIKLQGTATSVTSDDGTRSLPSVTNANVTVLDVASKQHHNVARRVSEPFLDGKKLVQEDVFNCGPTISEDRKRASGIGARIVPAGSPQRRMLPIDKFDDERSDRRSKNFFRGFKLPAIRGNISTKVRRSNTENYLNEFGSMIASNLSNHISSSASVDELLKPCCTDKNNIEVESSDDILAKYRLKAVTDTAVNDCFPSLQIDFDSGASNNIDTNQVPRTSAEQNSAARPYYDAANLTTCQAFIDTKRKLRLVLSSADVQSLPCYVGNTGETNFSSKSKECEFAQFLRLLLAEAINTQDKTFIDQLRETIRCLNMFDNRGKRKLLRAVREEFRRRSAFLSYLQQSKMILLQFGSLMDKLLTRICKEQQMVARCLIEVCSRLYLEQHERQLLKFLSDFQRLEMQDEKTQKVERFLNELYSDMQRDPIWIDANESYIDLAQLSIERSLMAQIYISALYPNGDADVYRDQVLYDHIKRLSHIITPSHKDLRIPTEYSSECPWPSAQAEISIINAYKTPRDKLLCVVRCCDTIMHLLRLSSDRLVPAADDLMPVLVYVLIKANPPSLLSTIQYVNGFYGNRMSGESAYWWTQFCSAVEFLKTID